MTKCTGVRIEWRGKPATRNSQSCSAGIPSRHAWRARAGQSRATGLPTCQTSRVSCLVVFRSGSQVCLPLDRQLAPNQLRSGVKVAPSHHSRALLTRIASNGRTSFGSPQQHRSRFKPVPGCPWSIATHSHRCPSPFNASTRKAPASRGTRSGA